MGSSIYAYQHPRIDLAARVLDLVDLSPSDMVADVGCGNGRYLAELAQRGLRGHLIGGRVRAPASRRRC